LRAIEKLISFKEISTRFTELEKNRGRDGYSVEVGIRSIFLQFFYDLSDREMEEAMRDNMAIKWFCGFEIEAQTPDHTYFCRIRKMLGDEKMAKIFQEINTKAKNNGILREVFVFVDSSKIITKQTTWAERDKALKDGEEKLNNENIKKYSANKDAKFGCNGKKNFGLDINGTRWSIWAQD
jgi:transposase, IS5 family